MQNNNYSNSQKQSSNNQQKQSSNNQQKQSSNNKQKQSSNNQQKQSSNNQFNNSQNCHREYSAHEKNRYAQCITVFCFIHGWFPSLSSYFLQAYSRPHLSIRS